MNSKDTMSPIRRRTAIKLGTGLASMSLLGVGEAKSESEFKFILTNERSDIVSDLGGWSPQESTHCSAPQFTINPGENKIEAHSRKLFNKFKSHAQSGKPLLKAGSAYKSNPTEGVKNTRPFLISRISSDFGKEKTILTDSVQTYSAELDGTKGAEKLSINGKHVGLKESKKVDERNIRIRLAKPTSKKPDMEDDVSSWRIGNKTQEKVEAVQVESIVENQCYTISEVNFSKSVDSI